MCVAQEKKGRVESISPRSLREYTPTPPKFFYMIMGLNFDDIITVSDMLDNSELKLAVKISTHSY